MRGRGAEKGSMFLKQLDNLFGLGLMPKRRGNDGQPGLGEEKQSRGSTGGEELGREGGVGRTE